MDKKKQGKAKRHWADEMALEIQERIERDEKLKSVYESQGILVYDEKTPSGVIHVGSGRGWVMHDVVAKALRDLGLKAEFILSSDDYDPYDKPNKDLDEAEWNQHLGKPFCDIPSPVAGHDSFGAFYFSQVTEKFEELGIECQLESTADNYKNGVFNAQIKTILDRVGEVQGIFANQYGEDSAGAKKFPFNVKCPECGKIATTVADQWDADKEELHFICGSDVVDWAEGCGHEGWVSPYNGGGKFPWKVEWAAKWPGRGVLVEFAGKDHFSKGGARTIANRIAMDILDYPPPYPSRGYATGKGYEFFQVGGAKMSTSKGKGMSFAEAADFFNREMLRYLLLKSKPTAVIDFDPEKNDIILLADQYDKMMRLASGAEGEDEEERKLQQRLLSFVQAKSESVVQGKVQVPLVLASTTLQTTLSVDGAIAKLQEMDHLPAELSSEDRDFILERFGLARRWLEQYAAEQFRFSLVDEEKGFDGLESAEADTLEAFCDHLEKLGPIDDTKALHHEICEYVKSVSLEVKTFYKTLYMALIAKDRGPQMANFILTIGRDKALKIFRASIQASRG